MIYCCIQQILTLFLCNQLTKSLINNKCTFCQYDLTDDPSEDQDDQTQSSDADLTVTFQVRNILDDFFQNCQRGFCHRFLS